MTVGGGLRLPPQPFEDERRIQRLVRLPARDHALRIEPRLAEELCRVRRQRIPQSRHVPLAVLPVGPRDDDPGLGLEPLHVALPQVRLVPPLLHQPAAGEQQGDRHGDEQPGETRSSALIGFLAQLHELGEPRLHVEERRAVAVELLQRPAMVLVDPGQHLAERVVERLRRIAADHGHQRRERSRLGPEEQLAQPHRVHALAPAAAERVAYEVLDRAQHRGHQLRILAGGPFGGDVRDQQAARPMDQEDVLHLEHEGVLQHDFGERLSAAPRLDPPLQPLQGEAVLERLVERLERLVDDLDDRLADGRQDHRVHDVDERARIAADRRLRRLLDRRCEHLRELLVAAARRAPPRSAARG